QDGRGREAQQAADQQQPGVRAAGGDRAGRGGRCGGGDRGVRGERGGGAHGQPPIVWRIRAVYLSAASGAPSWPETLSCFPSRVTVGVPRTPLLLKAAATWSAHGR